MILIVYISYKLIDKIIISGMVLFRVPTETLFRFSRQIYTKQVLEY